MSLALLGVLVATWSIAVVAACMSFLISSIKVMIDSYSSYSLFEYVYFNRNKLSVRVMIVSGFIGLLLILFGIILMSLVS